MCPLNHDAEEKKKSPKTPCVQWGGKTSRVAMETDEISDKLWPSWSMLERHHPQAAPTTYLRSVTLVGHGLAK